MPDDVTIESVTKQLFMMNWHVLQRPQSYSQRLSARLRGKDQWLVDIRRLVSLIRAKGSEFENLYEENRKNVVIILTKVANTCREYDPTKSGRCQATVYLASTEI